VIIGRHGPVLRDRVQLHFLAEFYGSLAGQVRAGVEEGLSLEQVRKRVDLEVFRSRAVEGDRRLAQHFDEWVYGDGVQRAYEELTTP